MTINIKPMMMYRTSSWDYLLIPETTSSTSEGVFVEQVPLSVEKITA